MTAGSSTQNVVPRPSRLTIAYLGMFAGLGNTLLPLIRQQERSKPPGGDR